MSAEDTPLRAKVEGALTRASDPASPFYPSTDAALATRLGRLAASLGYVPAHDALDEALALREREDEIRARGERDDEIRARYLTGEVTALQLAVEYGLGMSHVRKIIRAGQTGPNPYKLAQARGRRERDEEIVARHRTGASTTQLSIRYGLGVSRVREIVREAA